MANKKWVADARQILIDIERIYEDYYSKSYDQCVHDIFNAMRRIVRRNASFGFVKVKHGRWDDGECTACAFDIRDMIDGESDFRNWVWDGVPYCPNCGAKMDGDGNG